MNKEVYILGGGTSVTKEQISFIKDKDVIAVNKSFSWMPSAKYIISMDNTLRMKFGSHVKVMFDMVPSTKFFVVNLGQGVLQDNGTDFSDKRFNQKYDLQAFDIIIKSKKQFGIGTSWKDFRCGNNSGYSALQLALLLGYEKMYLMGIDLVVTDKTHFHNSYNQSKETFEKNLPRYFECFKSGLKEITEKYPNVKIYSCSKISQLNKFIPYKKIGAK